MDLVLLTAHYPYKGETFLEDEVRIAEGYFDRIIILTAEAKQEEASYYVPDNARVIRYRAKMTVFGRLIRTMPVIFSKRFWEELLYASRTTQWSLLTIVKRIVVDESNIAYLKESQEDWKDLVNLEGTIFYSYWLSSSATFISRYIKNCNSRIARAHGGDCFFNVAYHPYRREQLSKLDAVYAISEAGRMDLIQHYNESINQSSTLLEVARLGVTQHHVSKAHSLEDVRTVVTCSSVIPLKRLDLIVGALSKIKGLPVHWIHFGDGSEMESIRSLAYEKLTPNHNISYDFKGYVNKKEILEFYESHHVDLFVNCSDTEGIPVSMMEAMSYGIPAIGRDVGGVSELLDNECGILLPLDCDADMLSEAIVSILTADVEIVEGLERCAVERIAKRFSANDNYRSFYQSLVAN